MNIRQLKERRSKIQHGLIEDDFSDHFFSHFGFTDTESNYMRNKRETEGRDTVEIRVTKDSNYDG